MNFIARLLLGVGGALLAGTTLVGGLRLVSLIDPGTPDSSRFVAFEGYFPLPREGMLNIMDYLTLDQDSLFVTSETSGSVFHLALDRAPDATPEISVIRGAPKAHGIALVPSENMAFVTRSEDNTVDMIDLRSETSLGKLPVAEDPDAILYDPEHRLVYVASGDAHEATLIDPGLRKVVGIVSLGGKPEFPIFDPSSGLIYQNLQDTNSLVAVDPVHRTVTWSWPLGACQGPSGMALDQQNRRLFIVCAGNAMLVVFDMELHRIVAAVTIGEHPDSVAFDPVFRRLYATGKSGTLTITQQDGPDNYRVLDRISTHYGAHTLAVDPLSHRIYVAYASLLIAPRIAVFSARPPA